MSNARGRLGPAISHGVCHEGSAGNTTSNPEVNSGPGILPVG
jgi:hypothetical protein